VVRNKIVTPKSLAVAVRVAAEEERLWNFNTDVGIKFPIPVKPFVRTEAATQLRWVSGG